MTRFIRIGSVFLFLIFSAFLSPTLAQNIKFTPEDDAILSNCLAKVEQIANRAKIERRDCVGRAWQICTQQPDGGTTLGTTDCYLREANWWDTELNQDYAALRSILAPDLFESLRQAQIAWIAYRDATCEFSYKIYEEGTIRHILFSGCQMRTTAARALDLKQILNDWIG